MDIQSLRLFTSLARNLHFGRTGTENHLSPSAVSRHVQKLEDQLGYRLFLRDNRSVRLTPEGEIFQRYALDVLDRYAELQQSLGQQSETLRGQLTLFASVTAAQSILPRVLPGFREAYPEVHLQLETGYAVNALRRLWEGCDVVVAALGEDDDERLVRQMITSIPILAVAPLDAHAMVGLAAEEVDWRVVPMVLPTQGQTRNNVDVWLRDHGIRPNIYAEVAGNEATLSLVALGCGVGFVPELVIRESPLADRVRILDSGPALSPFEVGFCTRHSSLSSSSLIRAFWDTVETLAVPG